MLLWPEPREASPLRPKLGRYSANEAQGTATYTLGDPFVPLWTTFTRASQLLRLPENRQPLEGPTRTRKGLIVAAVWLGREVRWDSNDANSDSMRRRRVRRSLGRLGRRNGGEGAVHEGRVVLFLGRGSHHLLESKIGGAVIGALR